MVPGASKDAFTARLSARALGLRQLAPAQGVSEMLEFFRDTRAEGCIPTDGDMLLFQWGTYDWGSGFHFEVDITRQFIAANAEDDDAISQLHLTYRFTPSSVLADWGTGNRWCKTIAEIASFSAYIASHLALRAVADVAPAEVALTYEFV